MPTINNPAEALVLRESIRARITPVPWSLPTTFFALFLFAPIFVSEGVAALRILGWVAPIIGLLIARGVLSRTIRSRLDSMSASELTRADWQLRASSVCNQMAVGMGIWIIQSPSADPLLLPLFMTIVVVIWSIGMLSNLFSDFLSIALSLPILMGQPAVYWLMQGQVGISVGIGILMAMSFMLILVHRGSATFRESILMRFEKDRLLEQVEEQRRKTQEALQEAEAANDAKAYFMAAAKHDIKQPLYALGMVTDTLLMSDPPEASVELLNNQRASIDEMSRHFDALMDMGKFHDGNFEITLSRFELPKFASRIDEEGARLCEGEGLEWQLDVDDVAVSTDPDLLLRLVRNLLTNAVKYTDQGSVECQAKVNKDHVDFQISDTGRGIAPEHQEKVFDELVRLGNSGDEAGAGLGLSIVKKIDRALGLDLQMTSALGEGTRFSFKVPLATGPG